MGLTIRRYASLDEMKADEYWYWQSWPVHERIDAVGDMIETASYTQRLGDGAECSR